MGFGPQKPQEGGWQGNLSAEPRPLPREPGSLALQLLGQSWGAQAAIQQAPREDVLRAGHCVRHETYKHTCENPGSSPVARAPTAVRELMCRLFVAQAKGGNGRLESLCTLCPPPHPTPPAWGCVWPEEGVPPAHSVKVPCGLTVGDDKGPGPSWAGRHLLRKEA